MDTKQRKLNWKKIRENMDHNYIDHYKGGNCYYCGDKAEEIDHIPCIHELYCKTAEYFERNKIPMIRVSACVECNRILGHKPLNTINERVIYLYSALQRKYKKFLRSANWSNDELDEIEGYLRDYVEASSNLKNFIEKRIQYMEELFYDIL